jgi:hypothetical protein
MSNSRMIKVLNKNKHHKGTSHLKRKVVEKERTVPDLSELKVRVGLGEAGSSATIVVVIDNAEDGVGGTLVRSPKKLGKEAAQHCEISGVMH